MPVTHKTPAGKVIIRLAKAEDIPQLAELNEICFPIMVEENVLWNKEQLASHQRVFPEGQIVAEHEGKIVGSVASLIVGLGDDEYRPHTYAGITDDGYFHNHNPKADTLYGANVCVHPDIRRSEIGSLLYEARRDLCCKLNLRRILAGGRLYNYSENADKFSPEQYISGVQTGEINDLVLNFQLHHGFVVRGLLREYINDPRSLNYASLIEWLNPKYQPIDDVDRKVRVACVQYQMRRVDSFEAFADQVEYFVDTAADYHADFLVFPEFFSVQLLSQKALSNLPSVKAIARMADMEDQFVELMGQLARKYGVHIIGGSHPMRRGKHIYNMCPIFQPDGSVMLQPKLHITPTEVKHWGITGGNELHVFNTPKARIGVLICYDSEFPEAARFLADQGAEIIFVPYCTDDRQAWLRVRICSHARAIENQVYVVTAGVIGNLPQVSAMDIHYGRAAVFSPCDFEFARDGIQAEADSNLEMLLVTDLDINDLYRSRASGSVRPRLDRRKDLFDIRVHLSDNSELNVPESPS